MRNTSDCISSKWWKDDKLYQIKLNLSEIDLAYLYRDALSHVNGFRVFAFSDPLLALEHFKINPNAYRAIISDYRMSEKDGISLLADVKNINPNVRTILITAFEIKDEVFRESKCIDKFLKKPITMTELTQEVELQMNQTK